MKNDVFWHHAGISEIKSYDGTKMVRIPNDLFREEDIVELGKPVHWYYNTEPGDADEMGLVVISKQHLDEKDKYVYVDSTDFTEGNSEYRCTIPKKFFDDYEGQGSPKAKPQLTKSLQLPDTGFLHFMYHREMTEADTKSCYVLTDKQFDKRFSNSDLWDGELSEVPKFE